MSTRVAAPLERVFEAFTDLGKAAERIPAITSLEILTDGPFGEGTRWRETRMMFKKAATEEMWVTGFHPPHSFTVEANSHGTLYRTLYEFVPDGDGTTVTCRFEATPQSLGAKLLSPLFGLFFKGAMRTCMQGDLDAIRDACEGRPPAPGTG